MNKDEQDFKKLIGDYMKLWPDEMSVSETFVEGRPSPFKELILAHDEVELRLEELQNDKLWVLDWSMFKYLSALAKEEQIICISKIDLDSVKSLYLTDISKWREEFAT